MFRRDPGRGETGNEDRKRDGADALGSRDGQAWGQSLHVAQPRTNFLDLVFKSVQIKCDIDDVDVTSVRANPKEPYH